MSFSDPLPILTLLWYSYVWKDGRVVYCGCLENSWVNCPGGSNPSPSVSEEESYPEIVTYVGQDSVVFYAWLSKARFLSELLAFHIFARQKVLFTVFCQQLHCVH